MPLRKINRVAANCLENAELLFTGSPNEVYIEALDGEDFTVVIDLMKDFDYMGVKGFRIVCEIAGSKDQRLGLHLRASKAEADRRNNMTVSFSCCCEYCFVDWRDICTLELVRVQTADFILYPLLLQLS
jgi:hypothetical protein